MISVRKYFGNVGLLAYVAALFSALPALARDCEPLAPGSSRIEFSGWFGPKLPVYVYRPQTTGPESRIVFVMHGVKRDGDRYRDEWRGPTFMAVGMNDPVLGPDVMAALRNLIHGCPAPLEIADGGHFVQEKGDKIAHAALTAFGL